MPDCPGDDIVHDCTHTYPKGPDMERIIHFHSELSLAAFIREMPGKWNFRVEEDQQHAGWYTMHLVP